MLVETPISADGTCPAGTQKLPTNTNPECIQRIQSTDGLCPPGTSPPTSGRQGDCISNVFFVKAGLPTTPAAGEICVGDYDPNTNKCYNPNTALAKALPCPGARFPSNGGRDAAGFCPDPAGYPAPIVPILGEECSRPGVHINHGNGWYMDNINPHPETSL